MVGVGALQHEAGLILRGEKVQREDSAFGCKSLHSKKKSIFVGLNFYLNPNTVRAV